MTEELRRDLIAIVLEEAFYMTEVYALAVITSKSSKQADLDMLDLACEVVRRIESRCSKIEG